MSDSRSGFIDLISTDGVFGWVDAGVEMGRLARLTCTDDHGKAVGFSATVHRLDLADLDLDRGKHGFCVPLKLFDGLGRRVTFRDEDGHVLTDGENVTLPSLTGDGRADAPMRIFLHIPKTGGMSLSAALAYQRSLWTAIYMYENKGGLTIQELNQLSFHQRSLCHFAMGHVPFGIATYFGRRAEYITFLRNPKERLKSNLLHMLRVFSPDTHPDLIHTFNEGLRQDFDNLMTRMLSGVSVEAVPLGAIAEKDVDLALHNLETSFLFIGSMDRYEEHLAQLGSVLIGEPISPRFENVAPEKTHPRIDSVDWDRVHHRNRFDDMLYDAVRERGLYGLNPRFADGRNGERGLVNPIPGRKGRRHRGRYR